MLPYRLFKTLLDTRYEITKTISGHIDLENISEELLCDLIMDNREEWYAISEWNDLSKKQKFLKKFNKKAKAIEFKKGIVSFSTFCCVFLKRKENKIISNDIRYDEISVNPLQIEYFNSVEDIYSLLKEPTRKTKVNFEIKTKHKGNSESPFCDNCNGLGTLVCKKCEGSGREEFTSGYFANGEPKIKVGNCSNCQGAGKIKCSTCKGTGKMIILSDDYQIIRFVEDKYKILVSNLIDSSDIPFMISEEFEYKLDKVNAHEFPDYYERLKSSIRFWGDMSKKEIERNIITLFKNEKELIINNDVSNLNFDNDLAKNAFLQNLNTYKDNLKRFDNYGNLTTEMCKNISIPTIELKYNIGSENSEYEIYFFNTFSDDGSPITNLRASYIPQLSSWKLLF